MKIDDSVFAQILGYLKDGAFGVSIKEITDGILIERVDPVLTVDQVSEWMQFSPSTVRAMEKKGLLHAVKSKGASGALRFRKSRVVADLARAEEFRPLPRRKSRR